MTIILMKSAEHGNTAAPGLIEILIVLAVAGILATLLMPYTSPVWDAV